MCITLYKENLFIGKKSYFFHYKKTTIMAHLQNNVNCEPSKTVSCPWGKAQNSSPVVSSFSSLMDEEYAKELQLEESREIYVPAEINDEGIVHGNL